MAYGFKNDRGKVGVVTEEEFQAIEDLELPIATDTVLGVAKVDGTSIKIDANGTLRIGLAGGDEVYY